jgi:CRISPR system Cascade subunit CasB
MSETSEYYVVLRQEYEREAIRNWWESLEDERAERAQLRRCENPSEVLLMRGFHRLLRQSESFSKKIYGISAVAGLLSHVRENVFQQGGKSVRFGQQLGIHKEGGDKPVVSELRFYRLQKCRTLDEFYRTLRRIIMLLDRRANIISLADCILHWDIEHKGFYEQSPSRRFHFRMAQDYFSAGQ